MKGYSSVVEHLTADREVHGLTPCASFRILLPLGCILRKRKSKWSVPWALDFVAPDLAPLQPMSRPLQMIVFNDPLPGRQ